VRIRNISQKGLRRLYDSDDTKGLPADTVGKLRKMLTFLDSIASEEEVRDVPTWKAHRLTGDRRGTWSLHVSRNWRLTFEIDRDELANINVEDYH
jgi:proteic killer suppression protein